jgi:hypothetical protein
MDSELLAPVLDDDVTAIVEGRKTLDQCLAEYGSQGRALEPLLRIALTLSRVPSTPDPERKVQARQSFVDALRGTNREERTNGASIAFPQRRSDDHVAPRDQSDPPPNILSFAPAHLLQEIASVGA